MRKLAWLLTLTLTLTLTLVLLLSPGEGWGATYYFSPDGSGTICSLASPGTFAYAAGTKAGSGDTVLGLSGVNALTTTTAIKNNITIDSYDLNNPAILDGTGLTQTFLLNLSNTTLRHVILQNVAASHYAIGAIGGSSNIIEYCTFKNNYADIYRSNSNLIARHNKFLSATLGVVRDQEETNGYTLTMYDNFIFRHALNITNGNAMRFLYAGTVNLYNNVIGGYQVGISLPANWTTKFSCKNNLFVGNDNYNINAAAKGAGATWDVSNNGYLRANITGSAGVIFANSIVSTDGYTDTVPVVDQHLMLTGNGPGYLMLRFDDSQHCYEHYQISLLLDKYGFKGTFGIDWFNYNVNKNSVVDGGSLTMRNAYLDMQARGHNLVCHGGSHMAMDNESGSPHDSFFSISKASGGTIGFTITDSGSAPNESVSLNLTESVSGDNITIDLVAGTISPSNANPTGKDLTTLQGVRDWLATKTYLTVTAIPLPGAGAVYYPQYTKSRILKAVTIAGLTGTATKVRVDVPRVTYWEMQYPREQLNAEFGITLKTLIYPYYQMDVGTPARALSAGYTIALGQAITTSLALGDLRSFAAFNLPNETPTQFMDYTNDQIRQKAETLGHWVMSQCKCLNFVTHFIGPTGGADLTLAQWDYFCQGLRDSQIPIITGDQFAGMITAAPWSTSDSLTYTSAVDTCLMIKLQPGSPAGNAGNPLYLPSGGDFNRRPWIGAPIGALQPDYTGFFGF